MAARRPTAPKALRAPPSSKERCQRRCPPIEVPRAELEKGWGILTANTHVGFVASTSEARRQIKGGGLKVNDKTVTDEKRLLTLSDLTPEGVIKLSLGKKRHVLVRPV